MATTGSTGTINLTTRASSRVLERFKIGSCTEGLFSHDYNFDGVKTINVYSVDTMAMNDYNPELTTGASRFGSLINVGDTVQSFTLTQNKSFVGTIDESYNTQQMQIKKAGQILRRQTDEVIIPLLDKYRLNALATNADSTDIFSYAASYFTAANIVDTIMTANAVMSDELVPDTGRVLYMTYADAVKLKLASQVVGIDKLGEKSIVNGVMGKIDKVQVRLVPSGYLPSGCKFMIVKTGVSLAPLTVKSYKVHDGGHVLDGKIVTGHLMHDCFVLKKGTKTVSNVTSQCVRGIVVVNQSA